MALASKAKPASATKPAAPKSAASSGSKSGAKSAKALPNTPVFTRQEELHAYREMLLIRRFEEKSGQMYGMGLIGGFCHLYIGQEAVAVGLQSAMTVGKDSECWRN